MKIKHCHLDFVIIMSVIFSLWIPGAAGAGGSQQTKIANRIWVTEESANRILTPKDWSKAPLPSSTPDSDDSASLFNSSYQFYPYMAIFEALDGKSVSVTTDGGIRATLVPVAGAAGEYDIVGTVIYPAAGPNATPAAAYPLGRISTVAKHCEVYIQDGKTCIVFTQMRPELTQSFGGSVQVGDRWIDSRESPTPPPPSDQQTYGNIFVTLAQNFAFVLKCYDMTKIDLQNLQAADCDMPIFSDLSSGSQNYQKVTVGDHSYALPWGWAYAAANITQGESKTRSLDTASENQTSINTSVGVNASVSLFGATAKSHLTVGVKNRLDQSRESKTSNSSYDHMWTDYAFILNRTFAKLSDVFQEDVKSLAVDGEYDKFIDHWGTHYVYATTFGERSHSTLAMKEDQTAKATELGIDIDAGVQVGYKVMGQGGQVGVDIKAGVDQLNRIKSELGTVDQSTVCYGGGAGCGGQGGHLQGTALIPVQLDMRPISELLGPPFYFFPSDQDIYTRVHDELAQAIAQKVFLNEQDSLQLGASGTKYIVIRATMSSDNSVDIAKISKDDPKFDLVVGKVWQMTIAGQLWRSWQLITIPGNNGRPSSNENGVWVIPYSTVKQSIDNGDQFFPYVEAKTADGFTCSGVQLPEGTWLNNYYSTVGLQFADFISNLDNGSTTYKTFATTSSGSSTSPGSSYPCPNINTTVSYKTVNSMDELLAEVGTLQPRDNKQPGGKTN